jgi:glycine/D-amino acid oxidase-like deaminating enzyme
MIQVSTAPAQDPALDAALAAARALGVEDEAMPLSAAELAERCRSPRFRRGVLFRDGATVQPARLVRALCRAALAAGVTIHEHSPALTVRPGLVDTAAGRIRAPEIVLATNAWLTAWRPASRWLTNFGSYVVLTEPVPELLSRIGWTGGEPILDSRMFLHYFRTTEDGRVLMGSGSGPIGFGGRIDSRFTGDGPTVARAKAGSAGCCPTWRARGSSTLGAARSTSRQTSCRSSGRRRAGSTTARASRGTESAQAGLPGRSSPRSPSERTTN